MPLRFRGAGDRDRNQHDNQSVAACAMVRIIGHSPPRFSERGARVKPRPFRMLVIEFGDELVLAVGHEGGEIDAILEPAASAACQRRNR
jgi:hypothetical protein